MVLILTSCVTNQVQQAQRAYEKGKYQQAVELYTQVMKESSLPQYGYNLALSLIALGQDKQAIEILTPLLTKYPENMLLLRAVMVAYFSIENYDLTGKTAQKILSLNPYDFFGRLYQLYILYRGKESKTAVQDMKKLYKESEDPRAMLAIAQVSYRMGQKKDAVFWMQKYVDKQGKANDFFLLAQWQIEQGNYLDASENLTKGLNQDNNPLQRFRLARLYLLFLRNSDLGLTNLKQAIEDGFYSSRDFQALLEHRRLIKRDEVQKVISTTKPAKLKKKP